METESANPGETLREKSCREKIRKVLLEERCDLVVTIVKLPIGNGLFADRPEILVVEAKPHISTPENDGQIAAFRARQNGLAGGARP